MLGFNPVLSWHRAAQTVNSQEEQVSLPEDEQNLTRHIMNRSETTDRKSRDQTERSAALLHHARDTSVQENLRFGEVFINYKKKKEKKDQMKGFPHSDSHTLTLRI